MAKIKVNDLKPTGSELFSDSESFLNDLSGDELEQAMGGIGVGTIASVQHSCICTIQTIIYTIKTTIFTTRTPVIL